MEPECYQDLISMRVPMTVLRRRTDHRETVNEVHDACVLAGISPVPLWAGADGNVGSQMRDLAECPNNQAQAPLQ